MSIKKDTKKEIISKFATNEKDTGSAQVQIAVLTERINNLTQHFKLHKNILMNKENINNNFAKIVIEKMGYGNCDLVIAIPQSWNNINNTFRLNTI